MTASSGGDAARFERLGLYDPHDADADRRLGLLQDLVALGATDDDLTDAGDDLPLLAFRLVATPGRERLTLAQLAARAGVPEDRLVDVWRHAGFPRPAADDAPFTEADVELMRLIDAARGLFGDETTLQLLRVTGSALARVADAVISAFIVDLASHTMADDPSGVGLVRANIDTLVLLPQFSAAMDTLLRHHLLALRRDGVALGPPGDYETQQLAVGFSDLVDSSGLAQHISMTELGARLREFETRAASVVTAGGGRVIKHTGDGLMFVASDPVTACRIALDLIGAFEAAPSLPPVRSGVATGEVLMREGDCFGPVVNLAARLVDVAPTSTLLVSDAVRAALAPADDLRVGPGAGYRLKGFAEPLSVFEVARVEPTAGVAGRATL
ncbi:MAG TPA: adenylate/guanylate cyclase domain-containing protein [Acidimicrobiia bacterium]